MSSLIESIERRQLRKVPNFAAGDRVKVHFQVIEGNRRRTQVFEGVVIRRQGAGARETFTVRKQSFGVGVERTFPLHSPKVERIEIAARGEVRRAKLYYLRGRIGRRARVRERGYVVEEKVEAGSMEELERENAALQEAAEQEAAAQEEAGAAEPEAEEQAATEGEQETAAEPEAEEQEAAEGEQETAAEPEAGGDESGEERPEAGEAE